VTMAGEIIRLGATSSMREFAPFSCISNMLSARSFEVTPQKWDLLCPPPEVINVVSAIDTMTDHFYTFNTSSEQRRRQGSAWRPSARSQPEPQELILATQPSAVPPPTAPLGSLGKDRPP
jgi:hypothetical protein